MRRIGRKIRLAEKQVQSLKAIREALDNMMDFPGWDSDRMDEWIDMIALNEQADSYFWSAEEEMFIIEVPGATSLSQRRNGPLNLLIKRVNRINLRYQEKFGKPILALLLM